MKTLLPAAIIFCGLLNAVNSASAQTWMQTSAPKITWHSVASSPDGSKLVAASVEFTSDAGKVYTSTNSGVTWISNNVPGFVWPASSADGNSWAGASRSAPGVYVSTNSGITWKSITGGFGGGFGYVVLSADVNMLVAGDFQNLSTNFGSTWRSIPNAPSEFGGVATLPANGTKLMTIGTYPGASLFISTNMGTSWITNGMPGTNLWGFAMSADGNKIVVIERYFDINTSTETGPGAIYTTTNSGASWLKTSAPSNYWTGVASSADGNKLVAVASPMPPPFSAYQGGIYTSTNGGINWLSNNVPVTNWNAVACSADGNKMVAAVYGGGIYTSYSPTAPQLNLASSSSLCTSWIIPSTNFVLQQNLDLTTTNWITLTNVPMLNLTNLQNEITLSPTNSSGFFRLISK